MSNRQFAVSMLVLVTSMFFFMAWFVPATTTPPPEYVAWKEKCEKSGGSIFKDGSYNTYCLRGSMELRP